MNLSYHQRILLNICLLFSCCTPIFAHSLPAEDINAKLVATIESYMDASKDPCDDFYGYSCGNWVNTNINAKDFINGDVITNLDHAYNLQLRQILEGGIKSNSSANKALYVKLHDFYESCRQQKDFNISRYLDLIKPTDKDDWPQNGASWDPHEKWNIWSTMGRMAAVGCNNLFFKFYLNQQPDTSYAPLLDTYLASSTQMGSLSHTYYASADKKIRQMADDMYKLLRESNAFYYEFKSAEYVEMTISEFQQQFKHIDLVSYISALFGNPQENIGNMTILVANIDYFHKISELIGATSDDLLIQTLKQALLYYFEKEMPNDTWDHSCVHTIRKVLPRALDHMYDQEIYSHDREATDAAIQKVFKAMRTKFVGLIQEHSDEFSAQEIKGLQEKILKMQLNIGNLPAGVKDTFYLDYFQSWEAVKNDFHLNYLSALKHKHVDSFELLKLNAFSPLSNLSDRSKATPFYRVGINFVVIPYAYIRFPMVHPEFHELFLYAELGNSVGHEMVHGFDTTGAQYDAEFETWALNVYDKPTFSAGLECLERQDTASINEKIADFSGSRLSYETYIQQSEVPEFSGSSKLSNKQMYFVKFAQLFCSNPYLGYDSSHDEPRTRVPQVVQNNPEFEKVFSCPPKTGEDLVEICNFW